MKHTLSGTGEELHLFKLTDSQAKQLIEDGIQPNDICEWCQANAEIIGEWSGMWEKSAHKNEQTLNPQSGTYLLHSLKVSGVFGTVDGDNLQPVCFTLPFQDSNIKYCDNIISHFEQDGKRIDIVNDEEQLDIDTEIYHILKLNDDMSVAEVLYESEEL